MDQVSYSFGYKCTTRQYENATFNVSLKSDVRDNETPEEAFERVKEFVEERAHRELVSIRGIYGQEN